MLSCSGWKDQSNCLKFLGKIVGCNKKNLANRSLIYPRLHANGRRVREDHPSLGAELVYAFKRKGLTRHSNGKSLCSLFTNQKPISRVMQKRAFAVPYRIRDDPKNSRVCIHVFELIYFFDAIQTWQARNGLPIQGSTYKESTIFWTK
nr:hypothetical protein Itr_chr07CG00720 [Ipomoea trifida]